MILKRIKTWLDHLSSQAILYKLDKRKRVQELDTQKLYSLFYPRKPDSTENFSETKSHEIQNVVNEEIERQILLFAETLHRMLDLQHDAMPFTKEPPSLPDEVIFPDQMTAAYSEIKNNNLVKKFEPKMSLEQLSSLFQRKFGYSLKVDKSSISHPEAGNGLWLAGQASPGNIVALFPGVTYGPLYYNFLREMLGYPKIDEGNSYLITRYDGIIIDSKPWGFGLCKEAQVFEGKIQTFAEIYELEGRHPLAFGHFANHPGQESKPNVLLAAFDIKSSTLSRPYIPNVKCVGDYAVMDQKETVSGLVLVALRKLKNEELFVNYRLNPNMILPKWYHPVDSNEDLMRWA